MCLTLLAAGCADGASQPQASSTSTRVDASTTTTQSGSPSSQSSTTGATFEAAIPLPPMRADGTIEGAAFGRIVDATVAATTSHHLEATRNSEHFLSADYVRSGARLDFKAKTTVGEVRRIGPDYYAATQDADSPAPWILISTTSTNPTVKEQLAPLGETVSFLDSKRVVSDELFRGLRVRPAGADTIGARYDVDVPIERILDVNIQQFRRLGLPVQRWTQARAKLVGTLVPTRMWLDAENRPVQTDQDYSAVASAGGSEYGLAGHSTVISNAWNAIPSIAEPPESETMTAEDALLPRINRTTLEKQIQDQMTRPGQSVSSVSCGTSLPARVGATTACNVWVDGVAYPMYATTTSVTGTSVHYKIS